MTSKRDKSMLPGVGDSVELMRRMWGFAGLPGLPSPTQLASMAMRLPRDLPSMVAPTLDLDELDKRIADLRAVEQWLDLNGAMLRTTIQTLEVQRATIATLKGIGGAMMAPVARKAPDAAAAPLSELPPEVAFGLRAMATAPTAAPPSSASIAPAATPTAARKTRKRAGKKAALNAADAPLNPAAWWNTLQDQFGRIATAAQAAAMPEPAKSDKRRKTAKKKSS